MALFDMFISKKRKAVMAEKKALQIEIDRIKEAKAYLSEWQDIPMRELYPEVCRILHIKNNEAARRVCISVMISDVPAIANQLLQIRKQ